MTDKTKRHPNNCRSCDGLGVTEETAPVIKSKTVNGKRVYKTEEKGSGCPECFGTGRVVRQAKR